MDTQDGFIVGIYNYCDRWCERCTLTGRCRVFAEEQRLAFERASPPRPDGPTAPPPPRGSGSVPVLRSLGALAAAFEELPEEPIHLPAREDADRRPSRSDLSAAEAELHDRVRAIGHRLRAWLAPESRAHEPAVKDAVAVLQHFAIFVSPKVYRALTGRGGKDWDTADSDASGSAKAALVAFDRLGEAWLRLAELGAITLLEAAPCWRNCSNSPRRWSSGSRTPGPSCAPPPLEVESVDRQVDPFAVIPQVGHDPLVGLIDAHRQGMDGVFLHSDVPTGRGIKRIWAAEAFALAALYLA